MIATGRPLFDPAIPDKRTVYKSGQVYDRETHRNVPQFSLSQPDIRHKEIRRLLDIIHLSLQCNDRERAERAWAILAKRKDVDVRFQPWTQLAREFSPDGLQSAQKKSVDSLIERLQHHIVRGSLRSGLDEVELYVAISSFPFYAAQL